MFKKLNITKGKVFSYEYENAAHGPLRWGLIFIGPFLFIIGLWTAVAPIDAAAIADGEVVLNRERKTIQHLEGGLVDKILVEEGTFIERGEPIAIIRDLAQRARLNTLYEQLANERSLLARLTAEKNKSESIDFSKLRDGINLPASKFNELMNAQVQLLLSRKEATGAKIKLITARKAATEEEIKGLEFQLKATQEQLSLGKEELKSVKSLFKRQLATANRVMELQRGGAELSGEVGSLTANIARLRQAVAATDIEIFDLKAEKQNELLEEHQRVELQVRELTQQLEQLTDQLERTTIRAPVSGRVMDLRVHTEGAVLQAGERIVDVVPDDDRLIVEARLNPNDIDLVQNGSQVRVQLSAYKAKKVPRLSGKVLNVSADILTDDATGQRYFLTRVLVDDEVLKSLSADVSLYPGMPAQVFFVAGERTVANYLLAPIADATYRAFREE